MKIRNFTALVSLFFMPLGAWAGVTLTATYTDHEGMEVIQTESFTEEAPLHVYFTANPEDMEAGVSYEWHFVHKGVDNSNSEVVRYEVDTEYDFTESGVTEVTLVVKDGDDVIESPSINITISDSHLEMPNAFSPNGDGINDYYGAKGIRKNGTTGGTGQYKSIVEFHAYIFNRWGQKLYEWDDIEGYWDGTYKGHPVKDGVYFVLVKARGADGVDYNIRRDVNLIRKFNDVTGGTATDE